MKRFVTLLLALVMILSLATTASALDVATNAGGTATITVENAAKGVTYKVYKLFDATVSADGSAINYTGTIPTELADFFNQDTAGNITKNANKTDAEIVAAVQSWAAKQTNPVGEETGDGSKLVFTGLKYGYYAVTTSQGSVVTVDSTKPNATIYDKNTSTPSAVKKVNGEDSYEANIGETVTYTATFNTANYLGEGADSKKVVKYEITDTLPAGMTLVEVKSITVDGTAIQTQQFENGKIVIDWVDSNGNSLYANGADIVITYTATVNSDAVIDGEGNVNKISLQPYVDNGTDNPDPWKDHYDDTATVYTYAAALQKVDQNKKPLAGAKFAALGLTVEKVSVGVYRVVSYDSTSTAYGTEMKTDSEGQLVILGLSSESVLTVQETAAPAGYNKVVGTTSMTPVKTGEEIKASSTTIYYDENGNVTDKVTTTSYTKTTYNVSLLKTAIVVVNQAGTELPSTGGMGTTMFYIFGGILVLAAVVLLVTKKRMATAE